MKFANFSTTELLLSRQWVLSIMSSSTRINLTKGQIAKAPARMRELDAELGIRILDDNKTTEFTDEDFDDTLKKHFNIDIGGDDAGE